MLAAFERRAGWRSRGLLVAAVAAGVLGLSGAPALANPVLGLTLTHTNPYGTQGGVDPYTASATSFDRDSGFNAYTITLTNTGNAATSGAISVADQLPKGLLLAGSEINVSTQKVISSVPCTVAEASTSVQCTIAGALAPGKSIVITLHVHVEEDAADSVTNAVTASGGGGGTVTADDPTTIAPAVPFGLQSFTMNFENSAGEPFTQAGGHPFSAAATFAFNFTTDDSGTLTSAGGAPKDIETELPPGFLGDPQNTPQCPLSTFASNPTSSGCPADTEVGFVGLALDTGGVGIENGHGNLLKDVNNVQDVIYNLVPPPGQSAALAFSVSGGVPFILYAHVRSDGDYGITIGDYATGRPSLMAIRLTVCDLGVVSTGKEQYGCSTAPPLGWSANASSGPFTINPTECDTPLVTTRANSYGDPEYAEISAYEGGPSGPPAAAGQHTSGTPASTSAITGCEQLSFEPTVSFQPDSTSAGQPAGDDFDLNLPQLASGFFELKQGKTLSCAGDTWSRKPPAVDYRWLRNGLQIPGATAGTYVLQAADEGAGIQCAATGTNTEGAGIEAVSPPATAFSPSAPQTELPTPATPTIPPNFGGHHQTCEADAAGWGGSPTLTYQWLSDGSPIAGATGASYTQPPGDTEESHPQCEVIGTNASGGALAVSAPGFTFGATREAVVTNTAPPQFKLDIAEGEIPLSPPALKNAVVTFPKGIVVSPSAADGLGACSPAQIGLVGSEPPRFDLSEPACPESSKLGTVEIDTPLLAKPLFGTAYLAEQDNNPFHSLVALYLAVDDPTTGIVVKLAGRVDLNPVTGQLTATFDNNPQLPFSHFKLNLKDGPRAPLSNPSACGTYTTTSDLTPWSTPYTPDATPTSSFQITSCANQGSFSPSFNAGTASSQAGAFSPFTLSFARTDPEQELGAITIHTPPGLLGMVSQVPLCPEPQASQGTCSTASQIGHVATTVGPGPDPLSVPQAGQPQDPVYLTGPYKGAPFGLSIAVPAVAGPFNLGTVVVRATIDVDPSTAALSITTDPLPHILDGIPLQIRTIGAVIDRSGFIFNPTNCNPLAIGATIGSLQGASSTVSSRFQAASCASLQFKPAFAVSASGKTSKADGASLTAKVSYPSAAQGSEANIAAVKVDLPKQLPSRLTTLKKACTNAQFEANPAACPAASKIGYATVTTPLLPVPLTGPAIFVSHGGEAFPSLTMVLQGYGVTVDLVGSTFINKAGITSTTFQTVPDTPFNTFELTLPQGKYSALGANGNLCKPTKTVTVKKKVTVKVHGRKRTVTRSVKQTVAEPLTMPTEFVAQNGAELKQDTHISVTGCPKAKPAKKPAKKPKAKKKK